MSVEEMARFARQHKLTLFKVFLLLCLLWFLLNYYTSYLSNIRRLDTVYSQGVDSKTIEVRKIIQGKKVKESTLNPNTSTGLECEPKSIYVPKGNSDKVSCKRAKPTAEACSVIKKLFGNLDTAGCDKEQVKYDICAIRDISVGDFRVDCKQKLCKGEIELGVTDEKDGHLEWTKFATASSLEDRIAEIIHPTYNKKHFGFCFIRCDPVKPVLNRVPFGDDYDYDEDLEDFNSNKATQLLVLPPQVQIQLKKAQTGQNSAIDINLILLDSVSRHHFYRSLPKVLGTFEKINREPKLKGKVYDFKLFQTIKARTFESIEALFAGIVDVKRKPFGTYDKPYRPLSYETLLKPLKKNGYRSLFLEDLCWTWEWGIPKDLLVLNKSSSDSETWHRLRRAFDRAGIDDTDISLASCEIFRANGKKDPFHKLPKVCFNGRTMNEYFLEYLHEYQRKLSLAGENFITYYANDDSHEEYGSRLKTLDDPFSKYIKGSLQNQNMLTVMFSDHGNSYGPFVENTFEGRLELYHASLFIIVPDGVRQKLGTVKLSALAANQNRLISLLDLHYTLKTLIPNYKSSVRAKHHKYILNPNGLFSEVSPNRTCADMPRLTPHLCICQGYQTPVLNSSANAIIADFALGSLNNIIQAQFKEANPDSKSGFGSCQRLVAESFTNVRESTEPDGSVITRLDLRVVFTEPDGTKTDEVFFSVVKSVVGQKEGMQLVSFKRMTKYGRFEKCADKGVLLHLCVCSLHLSKAKVSVSLPFSSSAVQGPRILQSETETYPIDEEDCLFLLIRRYSIGASFECKNACGSRQYRFILHLRTTNMDSSHRLPVDVVIGPGGHTFLTVLRQRARNRDWKWTYSVQYGVLKA